MGDWVKNYFVISFVFMLISYLAPGDRYKDYYRLVTGLILTLLVIVPVFNLVGKDGLDLEWSSIETLEKQIDGISYEGGQYGFEEILNKRLEIWKNKEK